MTFRYFKFFVFTLRLMLHKIKIYADKNSNKNDWIGLKPNKYNNSP